MRQSLQIFTNSLWMTIEELKVNRLRTFLSLLGVTVGIFCIIAVLTITGSLEYNIRQEVQSLGSNVIYIQKWPWGGGGEYPWWKYVNWPDPTFQEYKELEKRVNGASAMCYVFSAGNQEVDYGDGYMSGVTLQGVTQQFNQIIDLNFEQGRYFTPYEGTGASPVVILGANIWEGLFSNASEAIGKYVRIKNKELRVIGVLQKYGSSFINAFDFDNSVFIPYFTARTIVKDQDPVFMVEAAPGVALDALKEELRGDMRAIRMLRPTDEDNFSLNEISAVSGTLDQLFGSINTGGWFIGIFALIVGAFGIANIMFVSVKERTNIIGIKKAIGARRGTILGEFLMESVILCVIGGLMGIFLVYIGTRLASGFFSYTVFLSAGNFFTGIFVSVLTGVIAGYIPAYHAARLDPVVAIRS
ncbi:MAG: ABC transporter permease [Thermoflavifilum aggregans]|nr:ABC transporter permease [Thermoflavifilum aggregans]